MTKPRPVETYKMQLGYTVFCKNMLFTNFSTCKKHVFTKYHNCGLGSDFNKFVDCFLLMFILYVSAYCIFAVQIVLIVVPCPQRSQHLVLSFFSYWYAGCFPSPVNKTKLRVICVILSVGSRVHHTHRLVGSVSGLSIITLWPKTNDCSQIALQFAYMGFTFHDYQHRRTVFYTFVLPYFEGYIFKEGFYSNFQNHLEFQAILRFTECRISVVGFQHLTSFLCKYSHVVGYPVRYIWLIHVIFPFIPSGFWTSFLEFKK